MGFRELVGPLLGPLKSTGPMIGPLKPMGLRTSPLKPMGPGVVVSPAPPLLVPLNTTSFEETLQRWRAVGNTASDLTGPRLKRQTSNSRNKHVTAQPINFEKAKTNAIRCFDLQLAFFRSSMWSRLYDRDNLITLTAVA